MIVLINSPSLKFKMNSIAERLRYLSRLLRGKYRPTGSDTFFSDVRGVVHIGANTGQERFFYLANNICVLWVEPIPDVFQKLILNLQSLTHQKALNFLISDIDGQEIDFHVTDNGGESSSIFQLEKHKLLWPEVNHAQTIKLLTTRFDTMIAKENIDIRTYQALVIDTQGAELLVLKGAESIIHHFKYIKLEVADFESYSGNCTLDEITSFMQQNHFIEHSRTQFAQHEVGSYFDITYKRLP